MSLERAEAMGLSHRIVAGAGFPLVLFANGHISPDEPLRVYLEGDGTPWLGGTPAADPTPRLPLALRLLARDPGEAVLLGRPCYHGLRPEPPCEPSWWTDGRYGSAVVDTMAAAISALLPTGRRVTLIGYSGGGVIAVLLAERLDPVDTVITVAANLDTEAWAKLHGYRRLSNSLNPAERPPLPQRIRQLHFSGGHDAVVPTAVLRSFAAMQSAAEVRVVDRFDHACCWESAWPDLVTSWSGKR